MRTAFFAAAAASLFAAPAMAVSVTSFELAPAVYANLDYSDPLSIDNGAFITPINSFTGDQEKRSRSPFLDEGGLQSGDFGGPDFSDLSYWVLSEQEVSDTATVQFNEDLNTLALLWGTIDPSNTIEFLSGGAVVHTIDGTGVVAGQGVPADGESTALVTLTTTTLFDQVRFSMPTTAFEFSLVDGAFVPIPLPAGGVLLATGLAGLVLRKRFAK